MRKGRPDLADRRGQCSHCRNVPSWRGSDLENRAGCFGALPYLLLSFNNPVLALDMRLVPSFRHIGMPLRLWKNRAPVFQEEKRQGVQKGF